MNRTPTITDGNTETNPTIRALQRYAIEEKKQRRCNDQTAHLNTFIFCAGVAYARGISLTQMFFALLWLVRMVLTGQVKRLKP